MKKLTYIQFMNQYRVMGQRSFGSYFVKGRHIDHDSAKGTFAKETKKRLRRVVKLLGLEKGQYQIRFNPGGVAVSGECILHTDSFYVQVSIPVIGKEEILYRKCRGQNMGTNRYASIEALEQPEKLVALLKNIKT